MKIICIKFVSFVLVLFAIVLSATLATGETFRCGRLFVTQDGAGSKDGTSWENASSDLKSLMDSIDGEAEIWVASGTYSPGEESVDTFSLKKGIMIYGGFAGTESTIEERDVKKNSTILSGGNISRNAAVVTARNGALSGDTRLDGFTVTGGGNTTSGGGLYTEINSSPLITECVFTANTAYLGGGAVYNYYSSPYMIDCTFSGNKSLIENGGGISNYYSSPTFANCSFLKNEAVYGGGMFSFGAKIVVLNSTFSDNNSYSRGAGMSNYNASVTVTGSAFSGNHAEEYGGGMYNEDSEPVISNCVFSNNVAAPGNGGGMANIGSTVEIAECKFSANEADFYGGGIANVKSSLKISDCVLSENKAIRFNGGGIVNWDSTLTVSNSQFIDNAAVTGGGIYNYNTSPVIEKSVFSGDVKGNIIEDAGDKSKTEFIN
ncbi:MAG: hypothetical protein FWF87_06380 [Synergistaceae bacterium]|nr:hypothetical protein [Synergistaceae bacterium]